MAKKKRRSFITWFIAVITTLFLGGFVMLNTIDMVYAANISGLSVSGLTASYDNGTWSGSGTTINGSVKTSSSSGCSGTTYTATTGTLTLTNSSGEERTLSFSGSVTLNSGTCKLEGSDWSGASFSKVLANGASVSLVISSNPSGDGTTSVSLTSITLRGAETISVTFKAPTNGSYTVGGTPITSQQVISALSTEGFAVVATPASGYKFFGWKNETTGQYISKVANTTLLISSNCTVSAVFLPSTTPVWDVSGETFTDLNEAITYATNNNKSVICLIDNGTLSSGNYSIPNGKTLLIPFDEAHTLYTTTPAIIYGSHTTPSAYKTLTIGNGATLSVENGGAISISSKMCAYSQMGGYNGATTGPGGRILMASNGKIVVKNGGTLYAWGYIARAGNNNEGSVEIQSGGNLYEMFQIRDWRGGTATSNYYSSAFPMNQYYVQNIECPLYLYSGAKEKLYSTVNMSSAAYPINTFDFIGSSAGLFRLSNGYIIRDYIEATDRMNYDVYGTTSISSMKISISNLPLIGTISINSADYQLPINGNMSINIHSSTTSLGQDIELLPGAEVNVDSGAILSIPSGYKLYVYDSSEWVGQHFPGSSVDMYAVGYSVANGTTAKRTAASLIDAKLNVNGTVNVAGALFTSTSGANITSSERTGVINFTSAPTASTSIKEVQNSSGTVNVSFTAAQLHNGQNLGSSYTGDEYTATSGSSANTTFNYCPNCDLWWKGSHTCPETDHTIIWKNYDGTVTLETDENVPHGSTPSYDGATPTRAADAQYTYTFVGWSTSTNATSAMTLPSVTADATYYAAFSRTTRTYTVTWKNYDGSSTYETDSSVPYGTTPTYNGVTPTREGNEQYTYTFMGWATSPNQTSGSTTLPGITGDTTYYAAFSTATTTYQVTFKNYDGSELYSVNLEYGQTPTYSGETPSRPATAQYTYTFTGWSNGTNTYTGALPAVTTNTTYTAVFSSTTNSYTITWKNEDGTVLETDNNVPYGTTPTYNGATPTKEGNEQYSYTFSGWTPAITTVTGNAVYTATFETVVNTFTVIWKNGDTTLETDLNVPYDSHPSYDGATPTRPVSGRLHYRFIGWSVYPDDTFGVAPQYLSVREDTTYYAIFMKYAIGLYKDEDGVTRLYDADGVFKEEVSGMFFYDSSIYEYGDDRYYYLVDGVVQEGYGLVAIRTSNITYLYYVLEDGSILMESEGCTFYVAKTNGYIVNNINVESGLYYFDSDGHMWFGNSLLTGNTEFGAISSTNAAIGGGN